MSSNWSVRRFKTSNRKPRAGHAVASVVKFIDSIRALAIFNVSVANSSVLAIVRKYQESSLVPQARLIEAMRMVENFHFQFTALTNSGSTGGTRGRYNRFAVRLEESKTKADVKDAIDDLTTKLRSSLPNQTLAQSAFCKLFYAPSLQLNQAQKQRARKVFVAYVLMGFAKHHKLLPAGQNLASWSIEHIKPQSAAARTPGDPVFSIGNLSLITAALNSELGSAPLTKKVKALRSGSAYFDPELESWAAAKALEPSDAQIAARAKQLAVEGLAKVWLL